LVKRLRTIEKENAQIGYSGGKSPKFQINSLNQSGIKSAFQKVNSKSHIKLYISGENKSAVSSCSKINIGKGFKNNNLTNSR